MTVVRQMEEEDDQEEEEEEEEEGEEEEEEEEEGEGGSGEEYEEEYEVRLKQLAINFFLTLLLQSMKSTLKCKPSANCACAIPLIIDGLGY